MSHQTKIETKISDAAALGKACEELGLNLVENTTARQYSGTSAVQPFVIKCKGPYDISAKKNAEGNFELSTDWWGGHVQKEVGANFSKLTQLYGVHKAMLEAKKKGLFVQRLVNKQGAPRLVITGRAL